MEWLKEFFKTLFKLNKTKLLEEAKIENKDCENEKRQGFRTYLKYSSNVERDDRNGYNIKEKINLKELV